MVVALIRNFRPPTTHFRVKTRFRDNNITAGASDKLQMKPFFIGGFKNEEPRKLEPRDYEPVHDGLGITHWLPPKRCKNCGD